MLNVKPVLRRAKLLALPTATIPQRKNWRIVPLMAVMLIVLIPAGTQKAGALRTPEYVYAGTYEGATVWCDAYEIDKSQPIECHQERSATLFKYHKGQRIGCFKSPYKQIQRRAILWIPQKGSPGHHGRKGIMVRVGTWENFYLEDWRTTKDILVSWKKSGCDRLHSNEIKYSYS